MSASDLCPCGSGATYASCCRNFLDEGQDPESAEKLMRSRYTAYVLKREEYLLKTWHPSTRPRTLDLETSVGWRGLEVLHTDAGGPGDREGIVEFVARYKVGGRAQRLHEESYFVREGNQWLYVKGLEEFEAR